MKEFDCGTCVSACCREEVIMSLTDAEVDFMEKGGTGLDQLPDKQPAKPRRRFLPLLNVRRPSPADATHNYRLTTDCRYLDTAAEGGSFCAAYEDPNRPKNCADFAQKSIGCRVMRLEAGVDTQADFDLYLEQTTTV